MHRGIVEASPRARGYWNLLHLSAPHLNNWITFMLGWFYPLSWRITKNHRRSLGSHFSIEPHRSPSCQVTQFPAVRSGTSFLRKQATVHRFNPLAKSWFIPIYPNAQKKCPHDLECKIRLWKNVVAQLSQRGSPYLQVWAAPIFASSSLLAGRRLCKWPPRGFREGRHCKLKRCYEMLRESNDLLRFHFAIFNI